MFNKPLKIALAGIQTMIMDLDRRLERIEKEIDSKDYKEWKNQRNSNKKLAEKEGYFYLNSKTDVLLLEQVIQEVNKDPDLAVMLRTADGSVLTLRSYPVDTNNKIKSALSKFNNEEE